MLVIFANQKGGVGKSTLSLLFAVFLGELGYRCRILDCDKQMSIVNRYLDGLRIEGIPFDGSQLENNLEIQLPRNRHALFDLQRMPVQFLSAVFQQALDAGDNNIVDPDHPVNIFDMPGHLDVDQMTPIFKMADIIITPTAFTSLDVDSTMSFMKAIEQMQLRAQTFIVPNRVSARVSISERKSFEDRFRKAGYQLTPEIAQTVNLTRYLFTTHMSPVVKGLVSAAFIYLITKGNIVPLSQRI